MSAVDNPEQVPAAEPQGRLRDQPFPFLFALIAVLCVGLLMRILMHAGRDWQGDEWGTILALSESYRDLLTHFAGWQTMNFYLASLKAISQATGDRNWLLVLPGIVFGGWTILLSAAISLRLSGRRAALVAALLVATNPYLVTYSVTIRSYIYLVAFSLLALLYLLDWQQKPAAGKAVAVAISGALALLAHLNAAYVLAAAAVAVGIWFVRQAGPRRLALLRPTLHLAIFCMLATGLALAAYVPQWNGIRAFRAQWSDTPPTSLFFLPEMTRRFFGEGWIAWPVLAAIFYAAWRAIRYRAASQMLLVMIAVPIILICAAGVSHFPHAYARFLIPILPMLLILAADGLAAAMTLPGRLAAALLLAAIVFAGASETDTQYRTQHGKPWDQICAYLKADRREGDLVMLVGRGVYGKALHAYGVLPTDDAAAALQAASPERTMRVFIVDADNVLPDARIVGRCGTLQLGCVEGTPPSLGQSLRSLLEQSTAGRVDARFASAYQELSRLCTQQGDGLAAERCLRLRAECMLRDERMRSTPPQMLR